MADAGASAQGAHVAGSEYIGDKTVRLVHGENAVIVCGDACRLLAAVLQQEQCIVENLISRGVRKHADNATHGRTPGLLQ
ncbi:hypothetical protein GCM10027277_49330 [Pseudoduganella ginsengisoli]